MKKLFFIIFCLSSITSMAQLSVIRQRNYPYSNTLGFIPVSYDSSGRILLFRMKLSDLAVGGGGGMTNPMTTLGDLIYEDGTPAPARLAGNTTTTKKFLTQTGNGSISASPSWGTLAAGDVPTLNQNTTGTASNITGILNASSFPALTGDVTTSSGSVATTIGARKVLYSMMPSVADGKLKGRSAGSAGDEQEITVGSGLSLSAGTLSATGGGGGADALGRYIVQISTNAPANAQILASLSTGLVKNTTTTGVLSIAAAGTDYVSPQTTLSGYGITDALSNSTTSTQDGYFSTIKLKDVLTPSHYLTLQDNENLTANHILSFNTGNADRTLTFSGDATVSGTNTGDQTITLTGDITGSGTGSFATTIGARKVLYSMMPSVADGKLKGRSAGSAGDEQEITVGSGLSLSAGTLSATGGGSGDMILASVQTVTGAKTFNAGTFILGAGSTSAAPVSFSSGTDLTTAAIGAMEFNGHTLEFTPHNSTTTAADGERGYVPAMQAMVLTSTAVSANVTTAQDVFDNNTDGNDEVKLTANKTYRFQGLFLFTKGATSSAIQLLFAYSGTIGRIQYWANGISNGVNSNASGQSVYINRATSTTVTTATTGLNGCVFITGTITVTTAGLLKPQYQYTIAPGSAGTVDIGSYFEIWPIGSNTVQKIGSWQ
jgi:hypothetical protein